jgi:uncharacterized protein (TIGR03067 family)
MDDPSRVAWGYRMVCARENSGMFGRWLLVLTAGVLLVVSASGQIDTKKEMKALEGTWQAVRLLKGTESAPKDLIEQISLVLEDDRIKMMVKNMVVAQAHFKVDPTKKPRQIDVTDLDGPNKGKVSLGIYELEGTKLKTCFFVDGAGTKKRPTTITGSAETPVSILELERVK